MIGVDGALYQSLEFSGEGLSDLTMSDRLTISNMAIEAGAKNGIFAVDDITRKYMEGRCDRGWTEYSADPDAKYTRVIDLDLSEIPCTVAWPHLPEKTHPATEGGGIEIDQVVIGSCTNGNIEDMDVAARVFALVDGGIVFQPLKKDGETVEKGETIATVRGPSRSVLTGERVALNLLQRLSGIATATAKAVKSVEGSKARIVDTRKSTPGLRVLEKYAVRCGGGHNHRFNLADGVLIKDNHIAAAGGITNAVRAARASVPHVMKIEVETETLAEVAEALDAGAEIIMRDSFNDIADKQFGELCTYNIYAPISGEEALSNADLCSLLNDSGSVSGSTPVYLENVTLTYGKKAFDVNTFIPQKASDLNGYVKFQTMTDEVDDLIIRNLGQYEDIKFCNITNDDLGLETEEEKSAADKKQEEYKELLDFVKETLGDAVVDVRLSHKLVSAPVYLTTDGEVSIEMEKYFALMGYSRDI